MASLHHFADAPRPLVFAHRGGSWLAPENTIAAFDNGINFWEEKVASGFQIHSQPFITVCPTYSHALPSAFFTEVICWLAPTNRAVADSRPAALLLEQRTLTVTLDEQNQEVALGWESRFQVGPQAGKVVLSGPNYNGLGLRLPESFNHVARFQNSADQPYTGNNTQNVIPAGWTRVSGVMEGRDVMLVMLT